MLAATPPHRAAASRSAADEILGEVRLSTAGDPMSAGRRLPLERLGRRPRTWTAMRPSVPGRSRPAHRDQHGAGPRAGGGRPYLDPQSTPRRRHRGCAERTLWSMLIGPGYAALYDAAGALHGERMAMRRRCGAASTRRRSWVMGCATGPGCCGRPPRFPPTQTRHNTRPPGGAALRRGGGVAPRPCDLYLRAADARPRAPC